jgi:hypothetical protein
MDPMQVKGLKKELDVSKSAIHAAKIVGNRERIEKREERRERREKRS